MRRKRRRKRARGGGKGFSLGRSHGLLWSTRGRKCMSSSAHCLVDSLVLMLWEHCCAAPYLTSRQPRETLPSAGHAAASSASRFVPPWREDELQQKLVIPRPAALPNKSNPLLPTPAAPPRICCPTHVLYPPLNSPLPTPHHQTPNVSSPTPPDLTWCSSRSSSAA